MKIAGKVVGAMDGDLRMNLPACYKSRAGRARIGCDEMPDDSKEVVEKVLAFLRDRLSDDDIAAVAQILSGEGEEPMPHALDSRFPHASRLRDHGRMASKDQAAFDARFGTERIRHDLYENAHPQRRPAAPSSDFDKMFPDARRLK